MLNRYIRNKKGLTLVEVLVASALLLLVFTGFINAFYYAINLRVNSQSRLQSMLKAQACIEEIRASRGEHAGEWSDIGELETWLIDVKDYTEIDDGEYEKDNVVIILTSADAGIPEELIPVHIEVSYDDKMNEGREKSVELQTRLKEF